MAGANSLSQGLRKVDQSELESVELGDTTTGTSGISTVQAEEWLERVVRDAEAMRRFEDVARTYTDLVGTGEDTLRIPKTTGHLSISATGTGEGSARTYSDLSNITTVNVTISTGSGGDFYKGGIAISKEAMMTTSVDLVAEARNAIAQEAAQDVDEALRSQAVSGASHNIDQSSSGVLTPDSISSAMEKIETDNYEPEFLVISPAQQHDLRTDSQFTNAAEYGSREVVANGEIGTYLGVRVVVSTNITNNANNKAVMLGQNRAGENVGIALVWKERLNTAMEFNREEAEQRIFYNQAFATATIHADSMATIQTA